MISNGKRRNARTRTRTNERTREEKRREKDRQTEKEARRGKTATSRLVLNKQIDTKIIMSSPIKINLNFQKTFHRNFFHRKIDAFVFIRKFSLKTYRRKNLFYRWATSVDLRKLSSIRIFMK